RRVRWRVPIRDTATAHRDTQARARWPRELRRRTAKRPHVRDAGHARAHRIRWRGTFPTRPKRAYQPLRLLRVRPTPRRGAEGEGEGGCAAEESHLEDHRHRESTAARTS